MTDSLCLAKMKLIVEVSSAMNFVPRSLPFPARDYMKAEFLREMATAVEKIAAPMLDFLHALTMAAHHDAGDGIVAAHAVDAVESMRLNVGEDLVPALRHAAALVDRAFEEG